MCETVVHVMEQKEKKNEKQKVSDDDESCSQAGKMKGNFFLSLASGKISSQ